MVHEWCYVTIVLWQSMLITKFSHIVIKRKGITVLYEQDIIVERCIKILEGVFCGRQWSKDSVPNGPIDLGYSDAAGAKTRESMRVQLGKSSQPRTLFGTMIHSQMILRMTAIPSRSWLRMRYVEQLEIANKQDNRVRKRDWNRWRGKSYLDRHCAACDPRDCFRLVSARHHGITGSTWVQVGDLLRYGPLMAWSRVCFLWWPPNNIPISSHDDVVSWISVPSVWIPLSLVPLSILVPRLCRG